MGDRPSLPGAIGASHLRVYDSVAPDGLAGGTPHLHTVCAEGYYVLAGAGAVQTLALSGYLETALEPGVLAWFTPGTIHRLVNRGGLEILVLMQNAGLPEAGDMVITLPDRLLGDAATYRAAADLPPDEQTTHGTGTAARARRDLAVEAFVALRDAAAAGDAGPLRAFHRAAARLVGPLVDSWRDVFEHGPLEEVRRTQAALDAVGLGDTSSFADASVHHVTVPATSRRMGCCGTLGTLIP